MASPRRKIMPLQDFLFWKRQEPLFATTLQAQMAAMRDHDQMTRCDVEALSVLMRTRTGRLLDRLTTLDLPFRLRILDTPAEAFHGWTRQLDGVLILEPMWHVQVVDDPADLTSGWAKKGGTLLTYSRTYAAQTAHAEAVVAEVA